MPKHKISKLKKEETQKNIRPPVVVIMGHVDHGKTKILDYIRKTKVAEGESGGITQHIGAYEATHKGNRITFIDTPGHEAFSAMRSRGAGVADIAVLVVAAEEGVKPQTKEAIKIIQEAKIPYAVALNKIDKEGANPDRVKQELSENGAQVESWGGKIPSVNISAKTGEGIDELLDTILLMAELEDLQSDSKKPGRGVVIESHRVSQTGNTATLILRGGVLEKTHCLVIGTSPERIKIMKDFALRDITKAAAAMPVVVASLAELPAVGDEFRAFASMPEAEHFAYETKKAKEARENIAAEIAPPAENEAAAASSETKNEEDEKKEAKEEEPKRAMIFPLILKSDVAGSKEALDAMLGAMRYPKIEIKIIKSDVGDINESDVKFAIATRAPLIVGFRVDILPEAGQLAEHHRVRIVTRDVIYELAEEIKQAMENALPGEIKENEIGRLSVLAIFKKDGNRQVIGGRVDAGTLRKGVKCKIMRGEKQIAPCKLAGLQREKNAVDEVAKGAECGCAIDSDAKIEKGDMLVLFEEEKIRRKL